MKNYRKVFALLMTVIMLLGMMPAATAELTGSVDMPNCSHTWDAGHWPNGAPSNCLDSKIKRYTCTKCGAVRDYSEYGNCIPGSKVWVRPQSSSCQEFGVWEISCKTCGEWLDGREEPGPHKWATYTHEQPTCEYPGSEETLCSVCGDEKGDWHEIPALGHNWGEWHWAHEQPSCNTGAWQVRECKRCGRMEDRWVEGGNHNWGEWKVYEAPTCLEKGIEHRLCSICGEYWTRELEALGHEMGEWTVVKQPTAGEDGLKERKCARCDYTEQEPIPYTGENDGEYAFASLLKSEASTPANGEYYALGEIVSYNITLVVPEGLTLTDVEITDPIKGSNEDSSLDILPVAQSGEYSYSVSYTVTQQDVDNGFISNVASAYFFDVQGDAWVRISSNEVIVSTGGEDSTEAAIGMQIVQLSSPANGMYYVPGEMVTSYYIVSNLSDDVTMTCTGYESAIIWNGTTSSGSYTFSDEVILAPGEDFTGWSWSFTIKDKDAETGYMEYNGTIFFTGDDGKSYSASVPFRAPCGPGAAAFNPVGLTVTKSAPAGSHCDFYYVGEEVPFTITVTNNTGEALVDVEITDPLKGSNEDAVVDRILSMQPGESVTVSFNYTVTEADAAIGTECFDNIAYATGYTADGTQVSGTSNKVRVWCVIPHEITLTKTVANTPANGEYFVPGELIEFKVYIKNDTPYPLYCVTLTDPLCEDQHIYDEENDMSYIFFDDLSREGAGGDTIFDQRIVLDYIVTEADAEAGFVTNTAFVEYMTWYGETLTASASVTAPCGVGDPGDFGLVDGLTVIKKVTSTPANGSYYVPGEIISFAITVANSSDETLINLTFHDPLISDAPGATVPNFVPGAVVNFQAFWLVTDVDAFASGVTNIAYVTATDADGNQVTEYSNLVTVPCSFDFLDVTITPEDPFGILSGLEVTKTVESLPLNGSYYTEGETVAYRITYTNTGELPLTDVEIFDPLFGLGGMASAEMLTPGESRYCFFDYVITGEDVARGYVYNQAIAVYMINDITATAYSNSVIVDTDGSVDTNPYLDWVYGEIIPPADGEPIVGEVDLERLYASGVCCSRTITYKDGASATYETAFCPKHLGAKASASMMMKAAITPEMQIQAASYASAIFRGEVEKMYQELISACDPVAKATVMAEYIGYQTELANYEALLKMADPEHPEAAAVKISEMWEEKCVTMCIELHTAADARKDSLSDIALSAGNPASACECVIVSDENGKKAVTETYCPVHAFPFSMTDALLAVNDPSEAWALARQIWNIELTNAYNKMSEKTGVNKALVITEFQMLNQWMTAREAQLYTLYPNEPEIVLETMVKIIMDRVSELCE